MRSLNGESLEVSLIEYSSYREVVWIAHDTSICKEHLNTGDCGRIGSHLLILYAHLLLISSMTLRGETPPKSSSIGGRKISPQKLFKSIADTKAWVVPTSRRGYIKQDICVLPFTNYSREA